MTKDDDHNLDIERRMTRVETTLEQHVVSCDKRNGLILKLVVWAFLGILLLVIEQTFGIRMPSAPIP